MERKKTKKNKGITLIALVITIIVLLILAAVTIAALSGDNGILKRATESKEQTKASQLEDNVKLAINEAIANGIGEVTEENLVNALNKNVGSDNYTITGDTTNGWDIVAGGKTYHVSPSGVTTSSGGSSSGGTSGGSNTETSSLDGKYSEGGITEDDIAPNDLFEYEILNNSTETAATVNTSLPVKTAKIKGIKRKYCNFLESVEDENGNSENVENTNYEIKYEGVTDTLIIPYIVKLTNPTTNEEDNYTITEVDLRTRYAYNDSSMGVSNLPSIENIIYPNTVKKIYGEGDTGADHNLKKIILSDNIEEIPACFFKAYPDRKKYDVTHDYYGIEYIHLPKNLVKIGDYAFQNCTNLKYIDLTNVTSVGKGAFAEWTNKQKIKVPFSQNESLPTGWSTDWLKDYEKVGYPTFIYKGWDVNYSDKDTNYSDKDTNYDNKDTNYSDSEYYY